MASTPSMRRGTVAGSDLPPVPLLLNRKTHPANNVIVGSDRAQIRFAAQFFEAEIQELARVTDETLLGHSSLLIHVAGQHQVDLSPEVRARTGVWSAEPIAQGSSAASTLIKFANSLLAQEALKRDVVERAAKALVKQQTDDILGMLWNAIWMLAIPLPEFHFWKEPWETPVYWLDPEVDPVYRLNSLYRDLVGFAFLACHEPVGARKFGVRPAQGARYKQWQIDLNRVYASIRVLSQWRSSKTSPHVCAMKIAAIWS
jgi:hypothetical protein